MQIVDLTNVYFSYNETLKPALSGVSFTLKKSELLYVLGGSSSGKSTLAMILTGVIPNLIEGDLKGVVSICGFNPTSTAVFNIAHKVGLVFQDSDSQLLELRVEDEIAFPLENLGLSQEEIRTRIENIMEQIGITHLASRDPSSLSGGEKQRLCIAAALALQPQVLVFDEPFTNLDSEGTDRLVEYLHYIRSRFGISIIVLDKKVPNYPSLDSAAILLNAGHIVEQLNLANRWSDPTFWKSYGVIPSPLAEVLTAANIQINLPLSLSQALAIAEKKYKETPKNLNPPLDMNQEVLTDDFTITCKNVWHSYGDSGFGIQSLNLKARHGEIIGIVGRNGSGKTTLLRLLAGLLRPKLGKIRILGHNPANTEQSEFRARVGMYFQNPRSQLLFDTIRQDIVFTACTLGRLSLSHDQEEKYIAQIAQEFKIEGRLDSSPDDLSYGEAQRASLAAILSTPSIEVLLLDEPTKGLDSFMREFLLNLLRSLKARGATIIITSHDMDFIYELADSVLALQQGVIIAEGSPQAILSDITIRERCHLAPVFLLELCNELGIPPVRSSLELTRVLHARL